MTSPTDPLTETQAHLADTATSAEPESERPEETMGPAAPGAADSDGSGSGGVARRVLTDHRVVWFVALVLAVALGLVVSWWVPLQVEASDREEVRQVARELALRLTTFEGEQIEGWVEDVRELSTGEYARQVDGLFSQDFRDALRDAQAVSRGELIDLFVQGIDGDEAVAFALVRQTIANIHLADPVQDELRMEIALSRVDEEWLVSGVAVLPSAQPQPGAVPDAEAAPLPPVPPDTESTQDQEAEEAP